MQFSTWSFAKLAVVLGGGGLLLGAAGSFLIAPMYVSTAKVRAEPSEMQQIAPLVLSRTSVAGIIQDPRPGLYRDELKTMPFEEIIDQMRNDIRIDAVPADSTFTISFQYPDPAKAQQTVAALSGRFDEERLHYTLPQAGGKHFLDVIDTASLPVRPIWPDRRLVEVVGCLLGLSIPFLWRKFRKKRLLTWSFAIFGLVWGLAGVIAGNVAVIEELVGNRYRSTAMISIQNGTPEQIRALADQVLSRTMQKHLSIAQSGTGGDYFTVSFEYGDRDKARQAVQVVMDRIDDAYIRTYASLPDEPVTQPAWGKFEVLEKASTPVLPVSPDRYRIAGEGGVAGLLAAALIALIRRRWHPEGEATLTPRY